MDETVCVLCGGTTRVRFDGWGLGPVCHRKRCQWAYHAMREAIENVEEICPACGKPSVRAWPWDRWAHKDGSANQGCWIALVRGERPYHATGGPTGT